MSDFRTRVFGYRRKEKEESGIRAILSRTPIFQDMSAKEYAAIERIIHVREYVPDEVIIRQDEPGMGMYIIGSGNAAVVSEPSNVRLSDLTEGDFFGEVSLLDETPRSATVVATSHVKVFAFFQSDLFSLIERNPRLGIKIVIRVAKFIGERLKRVNQQVLQLTDQVRILEKQRGA